MATPEPNGIQQEREHLNPEEAKENYPQTFLFCLVPQPFS